MSVHSAVHFNHILKTSNNTITYKDVLKFILSLINLQLSVKEHYILYKRILLKYIICITSALDKRSVLLFHIYLCILGEFTPFQHKKLLIITKQYLLKQSSLTRPRLMLVFLVKSHLFYALFTKLNTIYLMLLTLHCCCLQKTGILNFVYKICFHREWIFTPFFAVYFLHCGVFMWTGVFRLPVSIV